MKTKLTKADHYYISLLIMVSLVNILCIAALMFVYYIMSTVIIHRPDSVRMLRFLAIHLIVFGGISGFIGYLIKPSLDAIKEIKDYRERKREKKCKEEI